MNILAVDTAGKTAGVALLQDEMCILLSRLPIHTTGAAAPAGTFLLL